LNSSGTWQKVPTTPLTKDVNILNFLNIRFLGYMVVIRLTYTQAVTKKLCEQAHSIFTEVEDNYSNRRTGGGIYRTVGLDTVE
jgi:hypothetical protein